MNCQLWEHGAEDGGQHSHLWFQLPSIDRKHCEEPWKCHRLLPFGPRPGSQLLGNYSISRRRLRDGSLPWLAVGSNPLDAWGPESGQVQSGSKRDGISGQKPPSRQSVPGRPVRSFGTPELLESCLMPQLLESSAAELPENYVPQSLERHVTELLDYHLPELLASRPGIATTYLKQQLYKRRLSLFRGEPPEDPRVSWTKCLVWLPCILVNPSLGSSTESAPPIDRSSAPRRSQFLARLSKEL